MLKPITHLTKQSKEQEIIIGQKVLLQKIIDLVKKTLLHMKNQDIV